MPKILIGVNIVSLAYLSPGIDRLFASPSQLIELAREIGFDFVQVLPIRGAHGHEKPTDFIKFREEAWNPGTVVDFLLKHPGKEGPPKLHDILLFPNPARCAEIDNRWEDSGIPLIDHRFSDGGLVEVSPRLDLNARGILVKAMTSCSKVVIDTYHLQREYWKEEIAIKPTRKSHGSLLGATLPARLVAIEILKPVLAPVVHLNLRDKTNWFLSGNDRETNTLFRHWLKMTNHYNEQFVVLEYQPVLSGKNRELADDMLAKTLGLVR